MSFIVTCILITIICIGIPTSNFEDANKYKTKSYYVCGGDSAWSIYKETCPNANWNEWCSYVRKVNNKTSLENLYPGDYLIVPIPIG